MKVEIVAGWTEPLDFELLADEETPSGTLAGTVELILKKADGSQLPTTGDVTIVDATLWKVRYSPDAADLIAGNYRGRFKHTDINGSISYFPSGLWDQWVIRPEA